MRKRLLTLLASLLTLSAMAQSSNGYTNEGIAPRRTEFISYSTRNAAEKGDRSVERYYLNLQYKQTQTLTNESGERVALYEVEIPLVWRDRDIFLHTEGGAAEKRIEVNGSTVGSCRDNRTPSEFLISKYIKDGITQIAIISPAECDLRPAEMLGENPLEEQIFLYSQPPIHIHDILVSAKPNEEGRYGVLTMDVVVSSSRRTTEQISVGYDIYSPEKELKYYDLREVSVAGMGLDTLRFSTNIYGAMERLWSAESPKLYDVTLYLKRSGIISEYINIKVGFGTTTYADGQILRNGKPIDIRAAHYTTTSGAKTTEADIKALKKQNINTLYTPHPQPYWFYDICDRVGMYVVEQANINTDPKGGDRSRRGTLANNPQWLNEFLGRVESSYYRVRIHPSIVAWSLGGNSGGGYNMYKCYEWLKEREMERPVVYGSGEWNSDLRLPEALQ
ncbi:MAG: hypothetical protein IJZ09_04700 [Tidjanibacter sp.]|nr:hypothetical protein [Tidjanibacter sp.]